MKKRNIIRFCIALIIGVLLGAAPAMAESSLIPNKMTDFGKKELSYEYETDQRIVTENNRVRLEEFEENVSILVSDNRFLVGDAERGLYWVTFSDAMYEINTKYSLSEAEIFMDFIEWNGNSYESATFIDWDEYRGLPAPGITLKMIDESFYEFYQRQLEDEMGDIQGLRYAYGEYVNIPYYIQSWGYDMYSLRFGVDCGNNRCIEAFFIYDGKRVLTNEEAEYIVANAIINVEPADLAEDAEETIESEEILNPQYDAQNSESSLSVEIVTEESTRTNKSGVTYYRGTYSYPYVQWDENPELAQRINEYYINVINVNFSERKDIFLEDWNTLEFNYDFVLNFSAERTIQRADEKILSVKAFETTYSGGVHPGEGSTTENFDMSSGAQIYTYDLMENGEDSRSALIDMVAAYMYADQKIVECVYDANEIYNYVHDSLMLTSNWFFNEEGLVIYFPTYSIAPYAASEIDVTIPYSELHGIVKSEYLPDGTGNTGTETLNSYNIYMQQVYEAFEQRDLDLLAQLDNDPRGQEIVQLICENAPEDMHYYSKK